MNIPAIAAREAMAIGLPPFVCRRGPALALALALASQARSSSSAEAWPQAECAAEPIRVGRLQMVARLSGLLTMFGCHPLLAEPAGA